MCKTLNINFIMRESKLIKIETLDIMTKYINNLTSNIQNNTKDYTKMSNTGNQPASTNQPHPTAGSFDSNKYLDLMITSMMMKNNGGDTTSSILSGLVNFVIMMCAEDIKVFVKFIITGLIDGMKGLVPIISTVFGWIITIITFGYKFDNKIKLGIDLTQCKEDNSVDTKELPSLRLNLINLDVVREPLFKAIKLHGQYNETILSHELSEEKYFCVKRVLSSINISFGNINILFEAPLEFTTKTNEKGTTIIKSKITDIEPNLKPKDFLDMLPLELNKIIAYLYHELVNIAAKDGAKLKQIMGNGRVSLYGHDYVSFPTQTQLYGEPCSDRIHDIYCPGQVCVQYLSNILAKNYGINYSDTFYKLALLNSICNIVLDYGNNFFKYIESATGEIVIYNYTISNYAVTKTKTDYTPFQQYDNFVKKKLTAKQIISLCQNKQITEYFDFVFKVTNNINESGVCTTYTKHKIKDCSVVISSDILNSDTQLETEYNNFVQHLYTNINVRTDKKIKIFLLSIDKLEKVVVKKNPKFDAYEEKKRTVNELIAKNEKAKDMVEVMEFLRSPAEPKDIEEIVIESKVKTKEINSKYKNISKLYLRQQSKEKLMSNIVNYQKNKELLEELGMQNQLGIALYGEPGTGKSSTILAVASELEKDIYYLDFESITTNEDLSLAVNYITKCANNSIMVCEDIDCACPIVLKRNFNSFNTNLNNSCSNSDIDSTDFINNQNCNQTCSSEQIGPSEQSEPTVIQLMKSTKSKLTLEYFLNILQGTLTVDDFICIITTNHLDKLDSAFIREGRFNVQIELTSCDHYQITQIFNDFIGRPINQEVLDKIIEFKYPPVSIMTRCAEFLCRRLEPDNIIMEPFLS